jgi:GDP-fucose protein O-fucosyltransferase
MTGHIVDAMTGKPFFPPENRTNWNGVPRNEAKKLDAWTRTIGFSSPWNFDKCMVGFTGKPNDLEGEERLKAIAQNVTSVSKDDRFAMFANKPVAVDASPLDRLMETMANRKGLCIYNHKLQKTKVIHLMGDNASKARLLIHFYAFLFFENWKQDVWTKRFVRDHLRYVDEIQCAAARVVHAMRKISKKNGNGGVFDTFHIRRGDFQYKETVRTDNTACCFVLYLP